MVQGRTPYQKMTTPQTVEAVHPARSPRAVPPPHPSPSRPAQPAVEYSNDTVKTHQTLDRDTGRRMAIIAIAFLIFYVLLASAKLLNDYNSTQQTARTEHLSRAVSSAEQVSTEIANSIVWIDNSMNENMSPRQAARLVVMSPSIDAVAVLNENGNLIAAYPNDAVDLKQVSISNIENLPAKVDSLVNADGGTSPIIVRKTGAYTTIARLGQHALISKPVSPGAEKIALVSRGGKIIDGTENFGLRDPSEVFGFQPGMVDRLTAPGTSSSDTLKIDGTVNQLASVQIPNSQDLFLFQAKPAAKISVAKNNLVIFAILFLGTLAVISLLLNSLYKQLNSMREIHKQTEVSQQRFRAAIEGDRGGVWEIDLVENIAYLSESLASLMGMPRNEHRIPMSQFLGLFHAQDRERFLSVARRAHMQGEFDFDIRVAHLPVILQCRGRPSIRTGSNASRVIVGVALDITEQRGAQARLAAAESRLRDALSSMTDSFVVWDALNRLVVWNVRFEDFFSLQPGMLQPGMDYASVEYMIGPAVKDVINSASPDGSAEIGLVDGRWIRYIETTTAEGGRVSIGTNITEIRQREDELQENEKALQNTVGILKKSQEGIFELAQRYEEEKIRAEEANQSKSDFLANMSHELRTPLNAINGFSDIMQKEMFGPLGDPRYKEYVSDILFSGQHLLALINDILDMSKIEAGKMNLNTEFMYMHDMIAQVVRIIRGRAEEAQLTLNISSQEVQEIEADPRAVKQILLNLLTNAIKFTPENGTVNVELISKQTGVIVKVTDSGIGISQENIDRLAKPFEQVVDQSTKHKEGTGLGLALSKSLIELHGGNFKIESTLGQGTTVIFSLPNKPVSQQEEQKDNEVTQEISRLANDIANVLAENEVKLGESLLPESVAKINELGQPQAHPPTSPPDANEPGERPAA